MNTTTLRGLVLLLCAAAVNATDRFVPTQQYPHIANAMADSQPNDVIYVSDGVYTEPTIALRPGVKITSRSGSSQAVTIHPDGMDGPLFTATNFTTAASVEHVTLQLLGTGGNDNRALLMDGAYVAMEDVNMFNFHTTGDGGTIKAFNSKLELTDCAISGSIAGANFRGGAIWAVHSSLNILGGSIYNSTAGVGGGIYFSGYDNGQPQIFDPFLNIENLDLGGNTAVSGGGAYMTDVYGLHAHFWKGGRVTGNTSTGGNDPSGGGGVFCQGDTPDFFNVQFLQNTAVKGGALYASAPSLVDCVFENNTATSKGGALYGASASLTGLTFKGNKAENTVDPNDSFGGAIYSTSGALSLADCLFEANLASSGSAQGNYFNIGGAVYSHDGTLTAVNCLFAGNQAVSMYDPRGGACYSNDPASFTRCTFVDNSAIGSTDARGSAIFADDNAVLLMCNLDGNTVDGTGVGPVEVDDNQTVSITYSNVNGNLSDGVAGDWVGDLDGLDTGTGNKNVPSQFVDSANQDYRLKWTSPLLDAGISINGEPDFDLTTPDIGWQKPYPELTSLTTTNSVLPAGRYKISANTYLGAAGLVVDHDVVIRVAAGKKLQLDDPTNGGSITIGDANGARTAIVGAEHIPLGVNDIASDIIFGHSGPTQPCYLQIGGTLFNVGPTGLWFNASKVSLIGEGGEGLQNCEFQSYGGSTITFANCTGEFQHHNFYSSAPNNPLPSVRGVYLHYSDMDIVGVNFDRGNELPQNTSVYGVLAFGAPTFSSGTYNYTQIAECEFNGSGVYGQGNYLPTVFFMAEAGLTGNTMLESRDRAIRAYESTVHMDGTRHGMNTIGLVNDPVNYQPLVELVGSTTELYLRCGYNCFVNPQAAFPSSRGFVVSDQFTAPEIVDWSQNFWSRGFDLPGWTSFDLCNNPTGCDLPSWAEPYPTLNTCPEQSLGSCDENPTVSEEYEASLLAQAAFNYSSAWALWKSIVLESPESDEASLAAGLMKSVALNTHWGAENSPDLVADLVQAADSAWSTRASLGVLESTHAWVVEALHGDRELALAQLDTLLATWTDPADYSVVSLGIAEIASFPNTGGLSSAGGAAMAGFVRLEKLQAFQQHLLNGFVVPTDSRTETSPVHPAGFTLSPAMPNPFNPTTHLTLDVAVAGMYQVNLYNLQGQLVHRLLDESLSAGVQNLTVDGSPLASGVYFVTAVGPQGSQNQKLLLVK